MATSGEMGVAVAQLFEVSAVTIEGIDRSLSDAGLRRKGGRGRSGAVMTGIDIVNLAFGLILGVTMKDAAQKVGKITRMPRQKANVQWRPDPNKSLTALAEQVDQYQEYTASGEDLGVLPAGTALSEAATLGEGLAAIVDAMAAGDFEGQDNMAINLQMWSTGPSAKIAYATRLGVLRVQYETTGPEVERPVFERRMKLDEVLLRSLAEIIRDK